MLKKCLFFLLGVVTGTGLCLVAASMLPDEGFAGYDDFGEEF